MKTLFTLLTLLIAQAVVFDARAAETEMTFEKVPPSVQKTMRELVGKGQITKIVQEPGDNGGVIYEVAYSVGKTKFEAEVSPEGKVIVVDQQIALSEAPDAVRKVIEEKTAGGKIIKIEKATQGREVFYETEFTKSDKEHEVKVAPDGKVLAEE